MNALTNGPTSTSTSARRPLRAVEALGQRIKDGYDPEGGQPLPGYLAVGGVYAGLVGALALAARVRRVAAPKIGWSDLLMLTLGTHRMARTLAKDAVVSPLRAPVARFDERGGPGEVNESPRGGPVTKAVGELLTCPFCLTQWVATVAIGSYVLWPKTTRMAAAVMTIVGGADALQLAYSRLQHIE